MTILKFDEALGTPMFVRSNGSSHPLTERVYSGDGYWVQAIHDADGSVQALAITSCRADFNPRFHNNAVDVTLNVTTFFAALTPGPQLVYAFPSASSPPQYFEQTYGARPANYMTFLLGVSNACQETPALMSNPVADFERFPWSTALCETDCNPPDFKSADGIAFRSRVIPNTYIEVAPFLLSAGLGRWETELPGFSLGASRSLTLTVAPQIDSS